MRWLTEKVYVACLNAAVLSPDIYKGCYRSWGIGPRFDPFLLCFTCVVPFSTLVPLVG